MKHKIPGVTDELLSKAKEEFLENGYMNANLRRIANESGVSTNSIYNRFHDKAGLFDALVQECADELYCMLEKMCDATVQENNLNTELEMANAGTRQLIDYIYDHYEIFKMIFCKSTGTVYEDYVDRLSSLEEKSYKILIEKIGKSNELNDFFLHAVIASGYKYMVEMVSHNLNRQEAYVFMDKIIEFRTAGWEKILGKTI